jgi:hypothetical protein
LLGACSSNEDAPSEPPAGSGGDSAGSSSGSGARAGRAGSSATGGDSGSAGAGGGARAGSNAGGASGENAAGDAGVAVDAGGSPGSGGTSGGASGTSGAPSAGTAGALIADGYPGDEGIADDPDVVWAENFEQASVADFLARYDSHQNEAGMSFDPNVPARSSGSASLRLESSGEGENATDFYKNLGAGWDELYVRYYARYEANVPWHHTGVWIGGYNPPSDWPDPNAGLKPDGDDRFSISLEPLEQNSATPRMDFYNYWMTMHSWMEVPSGDTAYYGNSLIHEPSLVARDSWQCIELYIKLNPEPASALGAELALFVDDVPLVAFTDQAPLGYWIKDKFCPDTAPGEECTDYRPSDPELVPLDLQFRSDENLKLNALWPQNYITDPGSGSVWYDDMVLARRRIGCLR